MEIKPFKDLENKLKCLIILDKYKHVNLKRFILAQYVEKNINLLVDVAWDVGVVWVLKTAS